ITPSTASHLLLSVLYPKSHNEHTNSIPCQPTPRQPQLPNIPFYGVEFSLEVPPSDAVPKKCL
ncbi:unnamed protein product, partial [Ceratitis capitata]